jgi:hypothetical protein
MAHYKTIALELIQEQPELYERLRSSKRLLPAMDAYAIDLKAIHEEWMNMIRHQSPDSDPSQIASETLEIAVLVLRGLLRSESEQSDAEPLSLDAAMTYLRQHTPPA